MQERKSTRTPITRKKFLEINRDIKAATGVRSSVVMSNLAIKHGVSRETVRTIKLAGTWPKFVLAKRDRRSVRAVLPNGTPLPETTGETDAPLGPRHPSFVTREEQKHVITRINELSTYVERLSDRLQRVEDSGKKRKSKRFWRR